MFETPGTSVPHNSRVLPDVPCTQGELLPGKDIHEAYDEATSPSSLREASRQAGIAFKLTPFDDLSERSKELYERMADVLNRRVQGKPRTEIEPVTPEDRGVV